MKIHKFELPIEGLNIKLPKDARVLTANVQNGTIMLWILGDFPITLREERMRFFEVFVTGEDLENQAYGVYINTIFIRDFVGHVFEVFCRSN